jgi:excisionase family DNA binding protein
MKKCVPGNRKVGALCLRVVEHAYHGVDNMRKRDMRYMARLDDRREALSVKEWSSCLGTSDQDTRRKIKDGTIKSVKCGARVLIPIEELHRLLGRAQ